MDNTNKSNINIYINNTNNKIDTNNAGDDVNEKMETSMKVPLK
jgi:hypothetical protein